ncbi:hypothetical protein Pmani_023478 [Petrolisthes manimaculis]|uniref:Uncharacterized protein n=1 Tax=Petrolisthes manimaculis TaxID=1843537 RepID=A0AAE1PC79_9EUCA|nr:hypothetical protein Pmani_023478 [Petrolisthes manimaculis]
MEYQLYTSSAPPCPLLHLYCPRHSGVPVVHKLCPSLSSTTPILSTTLWSTSCTQALPLPVLYYTYTVHDTLEYQLYTSSAPPCPLLHLYCPQHSGVPVVHKLCPSLSSTLHTQPTTPVSHYLGVTSVPTASSASGSKLRARYCLLPAFLFYVKIVR